MAADLERAVLDAFQEAPDPQGVRHLELSLLIKHHPSTLGGRRGWAVLRHCERCDDDHFKAGDSFPEALARVLDPSFCPRAAEGPAKLPPPLMSARRGARWRQLALRYVLVALAVAALFFVARILAGCDCGNSHPPSDAGLSPDAGDVDGGLCGPGRVLCEGNCVEPGHPSCGDAS